MKTTKTQGTAPGTVSIVVVVLVATFGRMTIVSAQLPAETSGRSVLDNQWTRVSLDTSVVNASPMVSARSLVDCASQCARSSVCATCCWLKASSTCYLLDSTTTVLPLTPANTPSARCFHDPTKVEAKDCPVSLEYQLVESRCVKLHQEFLTHSVAGDRCSQDGGHLYHLKSLSLDSPALDTLYDNLDDSQRRNEYWMGADDLATDGAFLWTDGTSLPEAADVWTPDEPTTPDPNAHCVYQKIWPERKLSVGMCGNAYPFVCQIDV